MRLQESGEMYLETIFSLSRRQNRVRSIDVAESLGVSKPSVSRAVGLLKQGGYLTADEEGSLFLTESGREDARRAGELLRGIAFDKVFSSDTKRAKQTCAIALPDAEPEYTSLTRDYKINMGWHLVAGMAGNDTLNSIVMKNRINCVY